jgi:hypothetical protein
MSPFQPHFVTFEQFYSTIHRIFTTFLLFFSKLKAVGQYKMDFGIYTNFSSPPKHSSLLKKERKANGKTHSDSC